MRLVHLGHAMWLAEVAGLRLVFDPLIEGPHHGGVFDVFPPRAVHVDRLRADFLFVSHRHPDHFDVRSLRMLADADDETVVITSDELIERVARRVGFRNVRVVAPKTRVELDGVRFVTTPSRAAQPIEWGVMLEGDGAVVYNQVDTALGTPDETRAMIAEVAAALDRDAEGLIGLGLVRWQPLLEIEALVGGRIGFPHRAYDELLDQIAALAPRAVVPASAGAIHRAPFGYMNELVYPVTEARFLHDVSRVPGSKPHPAVIGGAYSIEGGDVELDEAGGRDLVDLHPHGGDPRRFRPLAIPEVLDPNLDDRDEIHTRTAIDRWVNGPLRDAIERAGLARRRLVLEVVHPSTRDTYTLHRGVERRDDDEWDARVAIAGSLLADVLEGRRHWGDVLLAGALRSVTRVRDVGAVFLYFAISYEQSIERAIEHELALSSSP